MGAALVRELFFSFASCCFLRRTSETRDLLNPSNQSAPLESIGPSRETGLRYIRGREKEREGETRGAFLHGIFFLLSCSNAGHTRGDFEEDATGTPQVHLGPVVAVRQQALGRAVPVSLACLSFMCLVSCARVLSRVFRIARACSSLFFRNGARVLLMCRLSLSARRALYGGGGGFFLVERI